MKYLITISGILAVLLTFFLGANAQEKMSAEQQQKKEQMMEMVQDSTMMNMMMEHIAKDDHLRKMMMHEMIAAAEDDTAKMRSMCRMMMKNEDMHKSMMKMMHHENMETMKKKSKAMQKPGQKSESDAKETAKEVLVKFKPDAAEAQINIMASEVGLVQVKEIKELRLRVFKVPSQKSVKEVIERCQKEPFVEYAEPNQTYKTQK